MSCSCNVSTLRLFARGLVQVHRLESGSQAVLPIRGSAVRPGFAWALRATADTSPATQRQHLHASRTLYDREDPVVAKSPPEAQTTSPPDEQTNKPEALLELTSRKRERTNVSNRFNPRRQSSKGPATESATASGNGADASNEAEAIAKTAWKFKKQGFDWKAFRSKDPAKRKTADLSNFDWENWKGKKFDRNSGGLNTLLTNLQKAQERDREAIGSAASQEHSTGRSRDKNRDVKSTALLGPGERNRQDWNDAGMQPPRKREEWMIQKEALKAKFPEGWNPRKRLSPDALAGIRALNAQFPDVYNTRTLAEKFEVSPEAIRRILKSRWVPSVEEEEERYDRWHRRGKKVWEHKAAHGIKPPKRWRDEGIAREPEFHQRKAKASRTTSAILQKSREQYMQGFNQVQSAARETPSSAVEELAGDETTNKSKGEPDSVKDGGKTRDAHSTWTEIRS
ncbi:hypothetical protein NQ176_g8860 [Zarea fungicola]|uniref:Uncharacterized protein n=1 Tax=Zarea fungicola TaxID=93591 RepID=A0ACC1MS25_9HYPO|nr:hypothetical protein NQ176_g8860 [Lecanicillium fungicola]